MMKVLECLYKVEEKIETYYIKLAELEINNQFDCEEYNYYKQIINSLTKDEMNLLKTLDSKEIYKLLQQVKKDNFNKLNGKAIALGFINNAYYFRLVNLLELMLGDDLISYAETLKSDINKIIFSFLSRMINNEYYSDIRKDLIFYKYNLIFLNSTNEYDFLLENATTNVSLEANNYRTSELPAYKYVDKTILVLESTDNFNFISSATERFKENNNEYALMVISVMNVLSRLMLCEEDTLSLIYDDLTYLLEDDNVYESIKDLVKEMLIILDSVKNNIAWAR
ncbi:MAG: hypothetical protein E7163_00830 [Firmicutes bacterium]|nr:hypothetical protein [Bacillota bacterium]